MSILRIWQSQRMTWSLTPLNLIGGNPGRTGRGCSHQQSTPGAVLRGAAEELQNVDLR